jgi:hypothetical protein
MVKILSAREGWNLSVRNAIDLDQPIPIPKDSPPLSKEQYGNWQTYIRETIHNSPPITPEEWLNQTSVRNLSSTQLWLDLAEFRQGNLK